MSNIPSDLKYTKDHEWLRDEGDGTATVGITDYAQSSLGDVTFVELPEVGAEYGAGDAFGVVESVKAASDLYMPVSGEIVEINSALEDSPESVNTDPYAGAWIVKVKLSNPEEVAELLDAAAYADLV